MIKASVFIATSLDGFIARADGAIDWLPDSGADGGGEDYGYQAFIDTVDVIVMGRNTYEKALGFGDWPYGDKRVVVLSSRDVPIPSPMAGTVESMLCEPDELVRRMAARGAAHLYIDGGRTIQGFLDAGLINQLIITRIPVLLGSGIALFGPRARDIRLRHLMTQSYPNGLVQSRYDVIG